MSDAVLAVPFSRLFAQSAQPADPSPAERHQAALKTAFEAGHAAGEARPLARIAELEEELDSLRRDHAARLEADGRRAEAAMQALEVSLAEAVTALGLEVAGQVLAREPALGQQTIGGLVAEALSGLPEGAAGTLRMNPHDAADAPALPSGWGLLADPELERGQMIAERGPALTAAGLAQRLQQLGRRLDAQS